MLKNKDSKMPHLCGLMQKCFHEAELALTNVIREKYHALNEEMITHLFWCELKVAVTARNNGAWSDALVLDLADLFQNTVLVHKDNSKLQERLGGLFCEIQLHNHNREGATGGDFGIFTSLPVIEPDNYGPSDECRIPIRDRALLVQAKLRQKNGALGELSENQEKLLPEGEKYSAFVFYDYDDAGKKVMVPFRWQSCKGATLEDMKGWLKNADPPRPLNSFEMISSIYEGQLGTEVPKPIKEKITNSVDVRPQFEIIFKWLNPPSEPDGLRIRLSELITLPEVIQVKVSQV